MLEKETVPILAIDDLGLKRLNFMKLDVEGMEKYVLLGAMKTIEKWHPIIYLETNRDARMQSELGYQAKVPLIFCVVCCCCFFACPT